MTGSSVGGGGHGAGDAGPDVAIADGDAGGPDAEAPTPTCKGQNSQCVTTPSGKVVGASIITCDPVYFVGPWTLLLERLIGSAYHVVQTVVVQEPGFGAMIEDDSGPPAQLTYRVCALDAFGVRCGQPFSTYGPVDCVCKPFSCLNMQACNRTIPDGCGGEITCGGCAGGGTCYPWHTCCAPGFRPDGFGQCKCAPPGGCADWNDSNCTCLGG